MPGVRNPYAPLGAQPWSGVRHAHCVDHVEMEGYEEPVCILKGQDREEVLAFARELLAPRQEESRRKPDKPRPGQHPKEVDDVDLDVGVHASKTKARPKLGV